jgi:ribosome-associated protein
MSDEQKLIKLDQFLKFQNLVSTGGEAKLRIQERQVQVNGVVEIRRGRKLAIGDQVTIDGQTWTVE